MPHRPPAADPEPTWFASGPHRVGDTSVMVLVHPRRVPWWLAGSSAGGLAEALAEALVLALVDRPPYAVSLTTGRWLAPALRRRARTTVLPTLDAATAVARRWAADAAAGRLPGDPHP